MSIIVTQFTETVLEDYSVVQAFHDFCTVKETFCYDPDDKTFVTIGLGGGTEITKAQLKTRALDINTRYPFINIDMDNRNPPILSDKTNEEIETMVDEWCIEKNA